MSQTFTITPKKRLLRTHRVLTVIEALTLGPEGLQPFGVDEDELDGLLDTPLDQVVLHVGVPGISGRGCELTFEDGAYGVREFTPATPADWRISLTLLSALAGHLGAPIIGEDGTAWSAETITAFDAASDISFGVETMTNRPGMTMPGVVRPVSLTPESAQDIREASSPSERFGEIFTAIQNEPGYDARLQLARDSDGAVMGIFALTEGVRTVLPRTPHLPPGAYPELRNEEITWKLALVIDEEPGVAAEADYAQALARLAPSSVHVLDAASLVVHELSGEEILALAG